MHARLAVQDSLAVQVGAGRRPGLLWAGSAGLWWCVFLSELGVVVVTPAAAAAAAAVVATAAVVAESSCRSSSSSSSNSEKRAVFGFQLLFSRYFSTAPLWQAAAGVCLWVVGYFTRGFKC